MEFVLSLGPVATVAQLVGNVGGLIMKIKKAVETARQNERECRHLAHRVSVVEYVLRHLPKDLAEEEVRVPLECLSDTLKNAHELVESCSGQENTFRNLQTAGKHAKRFQDIHARIDSDLHLFSVINFTVLNQIRIQLHDLTITSPLSDDLTITAPLLSAASGSQLPEESATARAGSRDPHVAAESFTWAEIALAIECFSHFLGEGSCRTFYYKGRLHNERDVAIKILKIGQQGVEDTFVREVHILLPLRHENIIRLLGWCSEEEEEGQLAHHMLVYEYMSNRTLRDHLHGGSSTSSPVMTSWMAHVEVLLGASRAIDHLHCQAASPVIHRNVTSSNILLDASWTPRLSGFGASVLLVPSTGGGGDDEHQGQVVAEAMGTAGYLDPVYQRTKIVRPASDVYSFGVVLLEALTGKQPVGRNDSENWSLIIDAGKLRDVLDRRPAPKLMPGLLEAPELVANTAVRCLWVENRPAMRHVVANLEKAFDLILSNYIDPLI